MNKLYICDTQISFEVHQVLQLVYYTAFAALRETCRVFWFCRVGVQVVSPFCSPRPLAMTPNSISHSLLLSAFLCML